MTRWRARSRGWGRFLSPLLQVVGAVVVGIVVVPWLLLARGLRLVCSVRALHPMVQCPRGCPPQPADGWFRCRACGGAFLGYAFGPCPACGAVAGQLACQECGHLIVNPHARP